MRWYGYGCFSFSDDSDRVVFDPHDGRSLGIYSPSTDADIVICTHNTYTRNCFRSIRGHHTDIVLTAGKGSCRGFSYEGLETQAIYGDLSNVSCRFTMDGVDILVCGCIGEIPPDDVIEKMKGVQIAIVPIGEYETMSLSKVNEFIRRIGAPIVIPSEFKTGSITLPLSNLEKFSEGRDPEDFAYVGTEAEFTLEDIQDYSGVWIFDC